MSVLTDFLSLFLSDTVPGGTGGGCPIATTLSRVHNLYTFEKRSSIVCLVGSVLRKWIIYWMLLKLGYRYLNCHLSV